MVRGGRASRLIFGVPPGQEANARRPPFKAPPRPQKNPLTPPDVAGLLADMKKVLSILVTFVFLHAQTWAHVGGPDYGGSQSVAGLYAGVLIPTKLGSNSLGIFTLTVPATGVAKGQFVIFASGATFLGTTEGIVDPDKLTLSAITDGNETVRASVITTPAVIDPMTHAITTPEVRSLQLVTVAQASGTIKAKLNTGPSFSSNTANIRLEGKGFLHLTPIDTTALGFTPDSIVKGSLDFTVDGFRQSAQTATTGTTGTGTTGTTGTTITPVNTGTTGTGTTLLF